MADPTQDAYHVADALTDVASAIRAIGKRMDSILIVLGEIRTTLAAARLEHQPRSNERGD